MDGVLQNYNAIVIILFSMSESFLEFQGFKYFMMMMMIMMMMITKLSSVVIS